MDAMNRTSGVQAVRYWGIPDALLEFGVLPAGRVNGG